LKSKYIVVCKSIANEPSTFRRQRIISN